MYVVTGILEEPAACTCTFAPTDEVPVFFRTSVITYDKRCTKSWVSGCNCDKFCMVATNVCGSWLWNLVHFTLLAPRIFKVLEICAPLDYTASHSARTNSIQQSDFCEADICSASPQIINTTLNPRVPYLKAPTTSPSHKPNKLNPCPPLLLFSNSF